MMQYEHDYIAPPCETFDTYCVFMLKYSELHHRLKDILRRCVAGKQISIEKALLLLHLHHKTSMYPCVYIHTIIEHHFYAGLNPSYILNKLSEHGLIKKQSQKDDKRKILVTLSGQGKNIAEEVRSRLSSMLDQRPGLFQSFCRAVDSIDNLIRLLP